jgi:alkylated DNA repair dioxygenase AlkB
VVEYVPQHGSLLIMRGRTNAEWEHMVPKTAKETGDGSIWLFASRRAIEN